MNNGPDEQQFHAEVMAELEMKEMQSDAEFLAWLDSIDEFACTGRPGMAVSMHSTRN